MLAFYMRVIPPTSPKMRKTLWAVVGFVTASAITTFFSITFWCGIDLSVNWSDEEEQCSVFSAQPLAQLNWALNIISELCSRRTLGHFTIAADDLWQYSSCHSRSLAV